MGPFKDSTSWNILYSSLLCNLSLVFLHFSKRLAKLTGGSFAWPQWGSDNCFSNSGIFFHDRLYSWTASVSVILWGGHHVTMAVEVLCDMYVTFTRVKFSGGPSAVKIRRKVDTFLTQLKRRHRFFLTSTQFKINIEHIKPKQTKKTTMANQDTSNPFNKKRLCRRLWTKVFSEPIKTQRQCM